MELLWRGQRIVREAAVNPLRSNVRIFGPRVIGFGFESVVERFWWILNVVNDAFRSMSGPALIFTASTSFAAQRSNLPF
jgi:hypothetical protein